MLGPVEVLWSAVGDLFCWAQAWTGAMLEKPVMASARREAVLLRLHMFVLPTKLIVLPKRQSSLPGRQVLVALQQALIMPASAWSIANKRKLFPFQCRNARPGCMGADIIIESGIHDM